MNIKVPPPFSFLFFAHEKKTNYSGNALGINDKVIENSDMCKSLKSK